MVQQLNIRPDCPAPFRSFIDEVDQICRLGLTDNQTAERVKQSMQSLLAIKQSWLPWATSQKNNLLEQAYVMATDAEHGPMVLLIVWQASAESTVHNHHTWSVVGVAAGRETCSLYRCTGQKGDSFENCVLDSEVTLEPDDIVMMPHDAIHRMLNIAQDGGYSVSVHVYGKDLRFTGRSQFDLEQRKIMPCADDEFID